MYGLILQARVCPGKHPSEVRGCLANLSIPARLDTGTSGAFFKSAGCGCAVTVWTGAAGHARGAALRGAAGGGRVLVCGPGQHTVVGLG